MKTSQIFAACIPILESREEAYICHAINRGVFGDSSCKPNCEDAVRAENIILERIGGHMNTFMTAANRIEEMLHDIFDASWKNELSKHDYHQLRIDWLKSLVAEFEAKGD